MKQFKMIGYLLCCLAAMAGLLTSCIAEENYNDVDTATGKEANVKVTLLMSASSPKTYAISTIDENQVESIDVLAFKADASKPSEWAFAYKAKGTTITDATEDNPIKAKKQFSVTLIKNSEQQTFVILANARNEVSDLGEIAVGTDKELLLARLVSSNSGSWNANNDGSKEDADPTRFDPFPMWGEVKQTLTDGVSTISNVGMLRGIARMDIVLGADVVTANNFKLNKIYVYNSKNKGYIVPANDNLETASKVNAATIPAEADTYTAWNNVSPLIYVVPDAMKTAFERTIYLYEADGKPENESSKATCVVVGGVFGSDTEPTYYRLDFLKKGELDSYFRDLLRNHKYRVNIKSVTGRGYATPDDAFNSKAINIVAEITEWDDGDMGDVVFDGQYMLAVSEKLYEFPRDAKTDEVFIQTDYDVAPNTGWKAVSSNSWLTMVSVTPSDKGTVNSEKDIATGIQNEKLKLTFALAENTTGQAREGTIRITAGRLTQVITVKQGNTPEIGLEIIDPVTGKEITELVFASKASEVPVEKMFDLKWTPIAASPIVNVSKIGNFEFNFNGSYDLIISGSLPGGTGKKRYTIQPFGITTIQLNDNPFMECISKVDYTVSNGESFMSKSLILRQMVYDLIPLTEDFYLLDGEEHSFKIKVNYPWRAELIDNGGGAVTNLITTAGNPNTASDITIRFETVNDLVNPTIISGTAKVRFYHTADATIYEDVELFGISGVIQPESNSYMVKPGGLGILIPVSRANADGTTRISADDAYTADLLWTDHAGGVKAVSNNPAAINSIIVAGTGNSGYVLVLPGAEEGNAVVTVKVGGVIKWSWHIWVTDYDGSGTYSNNGLIFMDRHIGALTGYTTANMNPVNYPKTGLMYHWGRKDPIPIGGSNNTWPTLYTANGSSSTSMITNNTEGSLALSIANPATYYTGNITDVNSWNSTDNKKTIYDPCPKGWRVPAFKGSVTNANSPWYGVTWANKSGGWYNGITWSSVGFYPASGYLNGGVVAGIGTYAYAHSANSTSTSSYKLGTASNSAVYSADYHNRSFGVPVRCVKE